LKKIHHKKSAAAPSSTPSTTKKKKKKKKANINNRHLLVSIPNISDSDHGEVLGLQGNLKRQNVVKIDSTDPGDRQDYLILLAVYSWPSGSLNFLIHKMGVINRIPYSIECL
jgi:hypothetical protein